jgi:hypothetical protein
MYPLFAVVSDGQQTAFVLFGCALFAAALFVYIFYRPDALDTGEAKTRLTYLLERKDATYENLRDLSFEYKAGKLSEEDYAMQRAALEDEAAGILAEIDGLEKARTVRAVVKSPVKRGRA